MRTAAQVYDPSRHEITYTAGLRGQPPAVDPVTGRVGGVGPTVNLSRTAIAHPLVRFGEQLLEFDLHLDDKGQAYLHGICPKCRQMLTFRRANKPFLHRPDVLPELGGELSVEEFTCTFDIEPGQKCGFRAAIDKNIMQRC